MKKDEWKCLISPKMIFGVEEMGKWEEEVEVEPTRSWKLRPKKQGRRRIREGYKRRRIEVIHISLSWKDA